MSRIGIIIAGILLVFLSSITAPTAAPVSDDVDGIFDLSTWDFKGDGPVLLKGRWEFYWQRFLSSDDFRKGDHGAKKYFVDVPRIWNHYSLPGIGPLKHGYATYRLVVKLPKNPPPLGLKMVEINTACRLYVNNTLVVHGGSPGTTRETTAPGYVTGIAPLPVTGDSIELILQVSNFHYLRGGATEIFSIGSEKELTSKQDKAIALDFLLFGSLLIMSLYHLGVFLLRRKDYSYLYFAIFCFFICMRIPASGVNILALHYPEVPWFILFKLRFMSFPALPCFFLFIHAIFKEYSIKNINAVILIPCITVGVSVFIVPMSVQGYLMVPFMCTTLATSVYVLFILGRAALKKNSEAYIVLAGFIILFVAILNDLLNETYRINLMLNILSLGVFLFILTQSFVLSLRFSRTFHEIEHLSGELKEKNEALLRLDRMKDDFLASTSHELRTPLSGIIGIAESMLDKDAVMDAHSKSDLGIIISSGKRLSSLVTGILDFSHLKHSTITLQRTGVDMRLAVEEIFAILRPLISGKRIALVNGVAECGAFAYADRDRVQQILHNLIGNALKFTMQGTVSVHSEIRDRMVVMTITDTGIGIPPDRIQAIFDPYTQADDSIAQQFGGTGLGLTITSQLVELHGGTIQIASRLGEGTSISFTIPEYAEQPVFAAPAERTRENDAACAPVKAFSPPREYREESVFAAMDIRTAISGSILIVDDEHVNIIVLQRILEAQGHIVFSASSGMEAIKHIDRNEPDLVILDIMMPGMSGYEVAEHIRTSRTLLKLPILMISARSNPDDIIHGFNCGINDYISKPFNKNELVARVATLLEIRHGYIEREKLTTISLDLAIARNLQKTILTKREYYRKIETADIEVLYLPANNRISGDYYNVHQHADGSTSLFLADATGHGIQAALFTTQIDVLHKNTIHVMDPAEKLARINETLITEIGTNNYFTAFSVFVKDRLVRFAGAGHHEQVIYRAKTGAFEFIIPKGILIGIMSGAEYQSKECPVSPGDVLILFTDGIYDIELPHGERIIPMGDIPAPLRETFSGPDSHLSSNDICEAIVRWFNKQEADVVFNDDISIIIMKMT